MTEADRKILSLLQQHGRLSMAELGEAVNLSASAVHRRVKMLEESGVIARYAAVLDPTKLGFTDDFFVEITLQSQSEAAMAAFEDAVCNAPEIIECHLMTGDFDYLLRVATRGTEDYKRVHRHALSSLPGVTRMRSSLALRTVRKWQGYNLIQR